MMKVLVACGCGMGSSQLLKMRVAEVFKKYSLEADFTHTSIDEAKNIQREYDLIVVSETFVDNFKSGKAVVIGMKNLMSKAELEEKLKAKGILS